MFLVQQFIEFLAVILKLFRVELTVVHLLAEVDYTLEIVDYIEEIIEIVIMIADIHHEAQHILLAIQRTNGINLIESILLKDNEVNHFGFPEGLMVIYRLWQPKGV